MGLRVWPVLLGSVAASGLRGAGVPVDGVTGANVSAVGTGYVDTNTGINYLNYGTLAAPVWHGVLTT